MKTWINTWWKIRACEMEPHSADLAGLNTCNSRMSSIHNITLQAAYNGLIINIITTLPTNPISAVCHEKYLNEGLRWEKISKSGFFRRRILPPLSFEPATLRTRPVDFAKGLKIRIHVNPRINVRFGNSRLVVS